MEIEFVSVLHSGNIQSSHHLRVHISKDLPDLNQICVIVYVRRPYGMTSERCATMSGCGWGDYGTLAGERTAHRRCENNGSSRGAINEGMNKMRLCNWWYTHLFELIRYTDIGNPIFECATIFGMFVDLSIDP